MNEGVGSSKGTDTEDKECCSKRCASALVPREYPARELEDGARTNGDARVVIYAIGARADGTKSVALEPKLIVGARTLGYC